MIWSVWEVGTDFWALAPRLDILGILGLWLLVPAVTRGINNLGSSKVALSSTLAIAIVLMVYSIFNDPQEINGESNASTSKSSSRYWCCREDWPAYGRTQGGERYSPLKQINDKNVKDLESCLDISYR
jgi:quinoprotein glucose dehydrogenase